MENAVYQHRRGIIGTTITHVLLILLFIYFGFTAPFPPPPEEGITVNFGTSETGLGNTEPGNMTFNLPANTPSSPALASEESGETEMLTQNIEDAPVIAEKKKTKNVKEKKTVTVQKKTNVQEKSNEEMPVTEPVKEKVIDQKALFPGNSGGPGTGTENQGITEGNDNQGSPNGDPNSGNYGPGGGSGNGISFDLTGRKPINLVKPEYNYQKSGIVVVEITVNKDGIVTEAIPGVKGSTTLDSYLLSVAKKAALESRFDRNPESPAFLKGTISYYFKLR